MVKHPVVEAQRAVGLVVPTDLQLIQVSGRTQGRGAAAARPDNGWQRVNAEQQHTAPHEFAVRTPTGPHQLPARNSSPVDYFFLLFTVATLRNVLRNTLAYADVVLQDMAHWIERHPASCIVTAAYCVDNYNN